MAKKWNSLITSSEVSNVEFVNESVQWYKINK